MGLFGKKNKDKQEGEVRSGSVEKIGSSSEELQDLLKEFKEMRAGIKQPEEDVEEIIDDVDGEEYELPDEDSESIENFLNGKDEIEDEPLEEEVVDEEPIEEEIEVEESVDEIIDEESIQEEEEILSEEPLEEEVVNENISETSESEEELIEDEIEEPLIDELEEEVIEDEIEETPVIEPEEKLIEEPALEESVIEEPVEEEEEVGGDNEVEESVNDAIVEKIEEEPVIEADIEEEIPSPTISENNQSEGVSAEELDQKFNDFEKRLLDKIMQQFMAMQSVKSEVKEQSREDTVSSTPVTSDDELNISTENGHLVINGYTFTGEVVMFTPLESVKQASWEEVVRRKGHCTYHLTTSGNGGWFIKKSNAPNPYAYIETKEDAEMLARIYAQREKAELKIHNVKGVIEKSLSFGREKLRG